MGGLGRANVGLVNGDLRVIPLICEEGRDLSRGMGGVIVGEFREREVRCPIILLIISVYAEVLFEDLIDALGLSVGLGVVGGREVGGDVEKVA